MYLKMRPCILNLPNEHISGRYQEHECRTIKIGWVLTYGDHIEITFQMLPKLSEWFHVGQMLWIHFKCSQIVIADKDPGTFNQSSQCSQHVITGPRYPCPQC